MTLTEHRPKPPALNALRAFEAAARHQSFAAAAEELSVTSGAVSQHVKSLEDWVGIKLFERQPHGVTLTDAGHRVLPDFVRAFNNIGNAVRSVNDLRPQQELQIATMGCLAENWLADRLKPVQARFPEMSISSVVLPEPPNLKRTLFDLSVFIRPYISGRDQLVLNDDPAALTDLAGGPVEEGYALVLEVPRRKSVDPKLVEVITLMVEE